jgi:hypothetical protein
MRIRNLQPIVFRHLEANAETRNSDTILYLEVLRELCAKKGIDVDTMTVPTLLNNLRTLHLPTSESVGRARRKLQNKFPELRADDDVEAFRELNEEDMRRYAREVCVNNGK